MKRLSDWLPSHKYWLTLALFPIPLFGLSLWLLPLKTVATFTFVVIWFLHLALGMGAGWAAVRLWYSRHHPLMKWVGLYINAFILDVLSAIVLLFLAKGVVLTWKFTTAMFVFTFLADVVRAPLIFYLIRGPSAIAPPNEQRSGEKPPEFWLDAFRQIVREENARSRRATKASLSSSARKRKV